MAADLDEVIDQYHSAAADFVKGDPEPYKALFSKKEDVSLSNPFGPTGRGGSEIAAIMDRASALYSNGEVVRFENLSKYITPELAYIVEIERFKIQIVGSENLASVGLRSTTIFRPEDETWKIVHRHADPITSARPPESVIQS